MSVSLSKLFISTVCDFVYIQNSMPLQQLYGGTRFTNPTAAVRFNGSGDKSIYMLEKADSSLDAKFVVVARYNDSNCKRSIVHTNIVFNDYICIFKYCCSITKKMKDGIDDATITKHLDHITAIEKQIIKSIGTFSGEELYYIIEIDGKQRVVLFNTIEDDTSTAKRTALVQARAAIEAQFPGVQPFENDQGFTYTNTGLEDL